jgi:CBS domain-containing protein
MVFGSEGRLERAFVSDQDNGLVFLPENKSDTDKVRNAMLPFSRAVNRALDICGFMLCPGDIMAGNPVWCLSVEEWRGHFSKWMEQPDPEALLNASIFFDFRPLYGQDELVDDLHKWLLPQPARHARFLRGMAEQALGCSPSLGWFGAFSYDGGRRYPHTIDLKTRGARLFVDAARIWALQHGVWTTNTVERLRAVGAATHRQNADTAATVEAFEFVQRLRIQRQLAGGDYDEINRVDPSELTATQRLMLKEAFKQARLLQLRLSQEFIQ